MQASAYGFCDFSFMPKSVPQKIYALTPRFHKGVLVRWTVMLVRQGQRFQRDFAVTDHGGVEGAKTAALAYRDELLRTIRPLSLWEFSAIVRKNNTSGVPGVSRNVEPGGVRWLATVYLANGKSQRRSFAVKKFGEERAKELAIEARYQLLQTLDGWMVHHPDGAPRGQALPDMDRSAITRLRKDRSERSPAPHSPERRVYRYRWTRKMRRGGVWTVEYWIAEYSTSNGKVRRKCFSVGRHGEEEARRLAWAQRREWVLNPPPPPSRTP
ncbi:AP2/ERF family transcription factor [Acidovorax sp. SUPP3334]|uniref:AP2/ERF family transcription factor n=1 Tax=Acidovorax sp. SUPP3334 TaxID=2920881 RepID=UPI0023DE5B4E|nr:AP2/ERF family transcription factor [Acidovorax sp. SUPP3334]GKT26869.1 AP2 domain-containing protein [Acidovorax sp. SUPP3334]